MTSLSTSAATTSTKSTQSVAMTTSEMEEKLRDERGEEFCAKYSSLCYREGYVKLCQKTCYKLSSKYPMKITTMKTASTQDICQVHTDGGHCKEFPDRMNLYCPGYCKKISGKKWPTKGPKQDICQIHKDGGHCEKYFDKMNTYCPNYCTNKKRESTPQKTSEMTTTKSTTQTTTAKKVEEKSDLKICEFINCREMGMKTFCPAKCPNSDGTGNADPMVCKRLDCKFQDVSKMCKRKCNPGEDDILCFAVTCEMVWGRFGHLLYCPNKCGTKRPAARSTQQTTPSAQTPSSTSTTDANLCIYVDNEMCKANSNMVRFCPEKCKKYLTAQNCQDYSQKFCEQQRSNCGRNRQIDEACCHTCTNRPSARLQHFQ